MDRRALHGKNQQEFGPMDGKMEGVKDYAKVSKLD